MEIYCTKDYDKFSFFSHNRPIKKNFRLEDSITKRNKLKFNPITVDSNFRIIDGQHRFEIAKKNGLDIYYQIDEDFCEDDIVALNTSQKNWIIQDYVHHYSMRGNNEYVKFLDYYETYNISVGNLTKFFGNGGDRYQKLKNGQFIFKYNDEETRKILSQLGEIKKVINSLFKGNLSNSYEWALLKLITTPGFKLEVFLKKCDKFPDQLKKAMKFSESENIVNCLIYELYNRYNSKNLLEVQ